MLIEKEMPNESIIESIVSNVLHVFEFSIGFLSMKMLIKKNAKMHFEDDDCRIFNVSNNQVMHVVEHRGQYEIQQFQFTALIINFATKFNEETLQFWHRQIDHLNIDDLKRLINMTSSIDLIHAIKHKHVCDACMKKKHIKHLFRWSQQSVSKFFECIDFDVKDFIIPQSIESKRYFVIFIDRAFDAAWEYLMIKKNEVFDIFIKQFQFLIENQSDKRIKRWRIDHDIEIENKLMNDWNLTHDIKWKSSAPYSSEQNGIAKRQNRTMIEKLKVMLIDVDLIDNFWEEIFYTIIYFRNRFSIIKLRIREIDKTFYEIWIDDRFELNHLRIIKCDAWHHISKKTSDQKKFNDRTIKCQLLNYASINQYKLWNPTSKKMIVSKNVIFDESKLLRMTFIDCYWGDVNGHDDTISRNDENDDVTSSFFSSLLDE